MQIPKTDSIKEVLRTIITYKKKKLVMKKSVGA
jgi:2-phosphoglycerate kinase